MAVPLDSPAQQPPAPHPDPDQTPILTLPRNITVRAYKSDDADSAAKHGDNHAIAMRMRNRFPSPYTRAAAETWINTCNDPSTWVKPGPFDPSTLEGTLPAIPTKYCICVDGEAVGGIGFGFGDDVACRGAEMGYWIGEAYWGRGIMSVVAPAFVAWAWRTFGRLVRLEGYVFEGNPASGRVLEKCGMVGFGRREKAVYKAGKLLGVDCFEVVREDCD